MESSLLNRSAPVTQWTAAICLTLHCSLSPAFVLQAQAQTQNQTQTAQLNRQAIPLLPPLLPGTPTAQQSLPPYSSTSPTLSVQVPTGTLVPVAYTGAERIVLGLEETMPLTLMVKQNVVGKRSRIGINHLIKS